jgi:F-type H+-transporting ATPase subunit delta
MSEIRIASRYAKSLFDSAVAQSSLETVVVDIQNLHQVVAESRDFVLFLSSPLLKQDAKRAALEKILSNMHALTRDLILLMNSKKREMYVPVMLKAFMALYNKHKGITEATVTSAVALNEASLSQIESYIKMQSGANQVQLSQVVNPAVVGGLTIEFEGRILDTTVAGHIRTLKKELQLA